MSEVPRRASFARTLQDLVAALPHLVSDRLELLALELHRAGRGLVQITVLVLAAALLGITAWLTLCVGLVLAIVAAGGSWPLALLVMLLLNLSLAWAAMSRARLLISALGLPATRRHLSFGAAAGVAPERRPVASRSEVGP